MSYWPMLHSHLVVVALATVAACGGAHGPGSAPLLAADAPAPRADLEDLQPVFLSGESMQFELSLGGVVGGQASVVVGAPSIVDGRRIVVVRSLLETTGVAALVKVVRDDVTTWVDLGTGRPIKTQADMVFGEKHTLVDTEYLDGSFALTYAKVGEALHKRTQRVPDGQHAVDAHAALGALRSWDADDGAQRRMYVAGGKRLWRTDLVLTARETLHTKLGNLPAVRIEGEAVRLHNNLSIDTGKPARRFTLWISDDASRVPLRISAVTEYGDIVVELLSYDRTARVAQR